MSTNSLLQSILDRELERLNILSEQAPLSTDDLKRLELLTRSSKQFSRSEAEETDLSDIDTESLKSFLKEKHGSVEPQNS